MYSIIGASARNTVYGVILTAMIIKVDTICLPNKLPGTIIGTNIADFVSFARFLIIATSRDNKLRDVDRVSNTQHLILLLPPYTYVLNKVGPCYI